MHTVTQYLPFYQDVVKHLQDAQADNPEGHALSFCRLTLLKQRVLLTVTSHTTSVLKDQQDAETFRYQADEHEADLTFALLGENLTLTVVDPTDHDRMAELLDELPIPWEVDEEKGEWFLHANLNRIPKSPPATQQQLQALQQELQGVDFETEEERFAAQQSILQKHFEQWLDPQNPTQSPA